MRQGGMGSGTEVFKKWNDLCPIPVTVTNSRKVPQQGKLRKILVFILAALTFNSKVYLLGRFL